MEVLGAYPYLGWCLLLVGAATAALCVCPQGHRLTTGVSSVLTIPLGSLAFLFVPEYWTPAQLLRWWASPEDILFGLANGALVWVLVVRLAGPGLAVSMAPAAVLRRYTALLVGGLALFPALTALGLRAMDASLVGIAVVAGVLWGLRPGLRRAALLSGLGFSLVYAGAALASAALWPSFREQWDQARLWGISLGGVPLEEFVWSFGFGLAWPLVIAHVTRARVEPAVGPA